MYFISTYKPSSLSSTVTDFRWNESAPSRYNIRRNRQFHFLCLALPKNRFRFWNSENLCWNKNRHPRDIHLCQFSGKTDNFEFFGPNLPKNRSWGWNFKNLSLHSKSAPLVYHVCQFSVKMDSFKSFGLNLGKLPNYVRRFGFNNAEGVAESWVERLKWVGWGWMELGGAG